MNDFLSIIIVAFCMELLPFAWCIWVFCARTQDSELQPSPHSKVTPLGVYGPIRRGEA